MIINTSIPEESFKAIVRFGKSSIYVIRFDATVDEEEKVINCSEASFKCENADYSKLVSASIAVKYPSDAQLALIFNHTQDPEGYAEQMQEYQSWRVYCKDACREFFNLDAEPAE